MNTPVEIRPLSAGPYPLVPNEGPGYTPHEYFECGDPDWCCHDPAPPEDEKFFELIPVPNATEPKVFGTDTAYTIDPSASRLLTELGFGKRHAEGLAIVFHDKNGSMDRYDSGYYDGAGFTDYKSHEHGVYYPLAVHVRDGLSLKTTNHIIWHELGHAVRRHIEGYTGEASYDVDANVTRTRRLGRLALGVGVTSAATASGLSLAHEIGHTAGAVAGPVGSTLAVLGMYAARCPELLLWELSGEERNCQKFARQHKQVPLLDSDAR